MRRWALLSHPGSGQVELADAGAAGCSGERGSDAVGHGRWVVEVCPGDPAVLHGLRSVGIGCLWFREWFVDGGLEFLAPEGETGLEVDDRAFLGEPESFGREVR